MMLAAPSASERMVPTAPMEPVAASAAASVAVIAQTAPTTLTIEQSFSLEEIPIGSRTVDTIRIANTGAAIASGVVVRVDLPTGLTHFTSVPAGTIDGVTIMWNLGTLAPGAATEIELTVRATRSGSLSLRASVLSDATNEIVTNDILQITATGLSPEVAQTPASAPAPPTELAETGAGTTWLFAAALGLLGIGVWALEASSRLPAMAGFRAPRRRRLTRPVFHPVRTADFEQRSD